MAKPDDIIDNAMREGLQKFLKRNPRAGRFGTYFQKHIDQKPLRKQVQELYSEAQQKNLSERETDEYVHNGIVDYVSSSDGRILDEEGRETVLRNSLKQKAEKLWSFRARKQYNQLTELDRTINAFGHLYSMLQSNPEYAQTMPEVAGYVQEITNMGFADAALDILKSEGLIDKKKWDYLKSNMKENAKHAHDKVVGSLEKNVMDYKLAASILGVLGIGIFLISQASLTGNVIGQTETAGGFLGIVLFLASLVLIFKKVQ